MAHRKGEFPTATYRATLERGICAECLCPYVPEDRWEVHHKIYLDFGIQAGIPLIILQSIVNSELLHKSCHQHIHNFYAVPPQMVIDEVLRQYDSLIRKDNFLRRPRQARLF